MYLEQLVILVMVSGTIALDNKIVLLVVEPRGFPRFFFWPYIPCPPPVRIGRLAFLVKPWGQYYRISLAIIICFIFFHKIFHFQKLNQFSGLFWHDKIHRDGCVSGSNHSHFVLISTWRTSNTIISDCSRNEIIDSMLTNVSFDFLQEGL